MSRVPGHDALRFTGQSIVRRRSVRIKRTGPDGRPVAVEAGDDGGWGVSLPRFLFLAIASPGAGAARAGVEFHWRLVGGNNHVLGRCPAAYRELELCQEAVVRLAAGIEDFSATVALANRPGGWTWQLTGPGPVDDPGVEVSAEAAAPVEHIFAMSARSYERQRECRVGLENFVAAAPAAVVVSKVTVRPRIREVTRLRPFVPSSRVSPESARRGIRLR